MVYCFGYKKITDVTAKVKASTNLKIQFYVPIGAVGSNEPFSWNCNFYAAVII